MSCIDKKILRQRDLGGIEQYRYKLSKADINSLYQQKLLLSQVLLFMFSNKRKRQYEDGG